VKRIVKVLGGIGIALLVLLIILVLTAIWFVRRPWSRMDGEIQVAGLSGPAEVIRDKWGVPHIYAENEHDLFFAQGYVHAQDRLWQMEFNRRTARGTLSQVLGEATLGIDRFMRTLGLREAAERDYAAMDDSTRALVEAYAQGVNAFVEAHRKRLPLEFTILGVDPEPWTPVDSLSWGKVMALSLSGDYSSELLRARVIAELGTEAAQRLMPPYPDGAPVIVPPEARSYAWLREAQLSSRDTLEAALGESRAEWGSNNWVVHGSRSATGMPLLANDTHLGLDMPSVWYENGIHGPGLDSVGYTFPGVPSVVIGHNGRIAWGVTNLGPDVQDLYMERLDDPVRPTKYEFKGEWRDLEIRYETIEVKGQKPVSLKVLETHHGPIINRIAGDLAGAELLALRWTALDTGTLFCAVKLLNRATDWDSFREALSYWDVPSQNFVYADVSGNIGYQTPGNIPIRSADHQGLVPVPGWTGDYEWQGFIPYDELPSVLNPPAGFLATANNKVVPDDYPYHLGYGWAAPYRAQRITDLLAASDQVSIEDMRDIHAQTYSLPAEALVPYLLKTEPQTDLEASALALVADWDLSLEADQPAASVYQVWYWFLVKNTLRDELGDDLFDTFGSSHITTMMSLMPDPEDPWFDDVRTSQMETRSDVVARSLSNAVEWLSQELGDAPHAWAWGRLHTKTFIHQPLGQSGIRLVENLFNSPTIAARGDGFTVDAAGFSFRKPYAMGGGVSQRYIADLSDLDNSRIIHTTGQSGQLFHEHREDFIPLWQNVEYHPMLFGRQAVEDHAEDTLILTPP
jgi:penicillin amidase